MTVIFLGRPWKHKIKTVGWKSSLHHGYQNHYIYIYITPLHLGVKLGFLLLLNRGVPLNKKKTTPRRPSTPVLVMAMAPWCRDDSSASRRKVVQPPPIPHEKPVGKTHPPWIHWERFPDWAGYTSHFLWQQLAWFLLKGLKSYLKKSSLDSLQWFFHHG